MDTEKQKQCRYDDARLAESGNARSEQLPVMPTLRVANQQRMAARRALEWVGTSKARLVFRYEISDLLLPVKMVFPMCTQVHVRGVQGLRILRYLNFLKWLNLTSLVAKHLQHPLLYSRKNAEQEST